MVASEGDRPRPGIAWLVCSHCGGVTGGRGKMVQSCVLGTGVPAPGGDHKAALRCDHCGWGQWWDPEPRGSFRPRKGN